MKITKIRRAARGMPCTIRLPGCDGGGETTVAAHYRLSGLCGIGQKSPDQIAAHACFSCHQKVDFREQLEGWSRDQIRLAHAEGVMRTFAELRKEGLL